MSCLFCFFIYSLCLCSVSLFTSNCQTAMLRRVVFFCPSSFYLSLYLSCLAVSVLSHPPTSLLFLSKTFRASPSSTQSQFGRFVRSRACEVRVGGTMRYCLLTCFILCPLRVPSQTELGDGCPHICVPFEPSPCLAAETFSFVFKNLLYL